MLSLACGIDHRERIFVHMPVLGRATGTLNWFSLFSYKGNILYVDLDIFSNQLSMWRVASC